MNLSKDKKSWHSKYNLNSFIFGFWHACMSSYNQKNKQRAKTKMEKSKYILKNKLDKLRDMVLGMLHHHSPGNDFPKSFEQHFSGSVSK